jgi:hypothetical protein
MHHYYMVNAQENKMNFQTLNKVAGVQNVEEAFEDYSNILSAAIAQESFDEANTWLAANMNKWAEIYASSAVQDIDNDEWLERFNMPEMVGDVLGYFVKHARWAV